MDTQQVADRIKAMRTRALTRDAENAKLIAIREGDYGTVAPGLFSEEFDKPLVANLIDTTARDLAEVFAPLPSVNCQPASMAKDTDVARQDKRGAIANYYVQHSRLQDQMYGGADRYGSFGFMAYVVEPDFTDHCPVIRVDDTHNAYYVKDYLGRVRQYCTISKMSVQMLCATFPDAEPAIRAQAGSYFDTQELEVAHWVDDGPGRVILLDYDLELLTIPNKLGKCPVRVVERPKLVRNARERGQFEDVIWVQVARALVQQYTMNAMERAVNAPLAVPSDVNAIDMGPDAVLQSDTPEKIGRVPLNLPQGLFPEQQILAQEQRVGSRYPEGRSGSIDASIVTGQGVQALMGTFDTQVQTFQRLNASALEDVIAMCFEMDEAYWGSEKKSVRIKDNGAPRKVDYVPSRDINGDYTVDVSYGAIAGLDPNRGLVFVLQALAGGLIAKSTARRNLPVDLNVKAEEQQIHLEGVQDSIAASIATLPQLLPGLVQQGQDPRQVITQLAEIHELLAKGKSPVDAVTAVFAPEEKPGEQEGTEVPDPLTQAAQAASGQGPALPGQGQGGASDLMMMLAGMTPGGKPNMQANVSRMIPAQG